MADRMVLAGWVESHAYTDAGFAIKWTDLGNERINQIKQIFGEIHDGPFTSFDLAGFFTLIFLDEASRR